MAYTMNPAFARAAAQDAANRQMRKAGRTVWDESDYDLACEEFARLLEYCQAA